MTMGAAGYAATAMTTNFTTDSFTIVGVKPAGATPASTRTRTRVTAVRAVTRASARSARTGCANQSRC